MIDPLTQLAVLHGTDKFGPHDYTPVYHALLQSWRDKPVKLLEIGVGGYDDPDAGGESLATWRDYFPAGQIVGFDIEEKRMDLGPRVTILRGSQVDPGFIAMLIRDHGPFDVIVDDGSHLNDHVWQTYTMLAPALTPGGIYIVEDVQTAFSPAFNGSVDLRKPNIIADFRDLAKAVGQGDDHPGPGLARIERLHNVIAMVTRGGDDSRGGVDLAAAGRAALWRDREGVVGQTVDGSMTLLQDADALEDQLDKLEQGDLLVFPEWPQRTEVFDRWFAHIDHAELTVVQADAPIMGAGRKTISLVVTPGGLAAVRGDNDYPSNSSFNIAPERVRRGLGWTFGVLTDESPPVAPSEMALVKAQHMARQVAHLQIQTALVRRLARTGAKTVHAVEAAVDAAIAGGSWEDAATIAASCHQALRTAGRDAGFTPIMAWLLLRSARWAEASEMLPHSERRISGLTARMQARLRLREALEDCGPEDRHGRLLMAAKADLARMAYEDATRDLDVAWPGHRFGSSRAGGG